MVKYLNLEETMKVSFILKKMRNFASKYFGAIIKQYFKVLITRSFKANSSIILIHTIGKVGSSSLYRSLKENKNIDIPVYHLHSLNKSRLQDQKNLYLKSKRQSIPLHLIKSEIISDLLDKYSGHIYLFTLIREPISRELSSIYQDSLNYTSNLVLENFEFEQLVRRKILALTDSLPENEWFEKELKEVFNIDIFKEEVQIYNGFYHKAHRKIDFVLFKMENLDSCYSNVISKVFPTLECKELSRSNIGEDKYYKEAYKKMKGIMRLNKSEIDSIFGQSFFQKFYSDNMSEIQDKWLEKEA